MSLDVDEDEHSIEMHLPFVVKVRKALVQRDVHDSMRKRNASSNGNTLGQIMNGRKFTAVPILVGNTKSKMDAEFGK